MPPCRLLSALDVEAVLCSIRRTIYLVLPSPNILGHEHHGPLINRHLWGPHPFLHFFFCYVVGLAFTITTSRAKMKEATGLFKKFTALRGAGKPQITTPETRKESFIDKPNLVQGKLAGLPDEVLIAILCEGLEPRDLIAVSHVCQALVAGVPIFPVVGKYCCSDIHSRGD
ncbi:hypothetical protein DL93DRAFT_1319815 [Clavulina sp. PMI_390]|nr:hypothetical protein DL93DRAFT_1319815 [Clavulina sp. PMI_390]